MNTVNKTLTLLDIQSMSPEKIDEYFRQGFTLGGTNEFPISTLTNINKKIYGLQTPTTCDAYMSRVFSGLANRTIDWQNLPLASATIPSGAITNWYKLPDPLSSSGTIIGVVFIDTRDATYNYIILIGFNGACCNTNPIKNCICTVNQVVDACIIVSRFDKSLVFIDYTAPNDVIDYALGTLPFTTNWLLVGGILTVGILAVVLATRK